MSVDITVGTRLPARATSLGHVLLAHKGAGPSESSAPASVSSSMSSSVPSSVSPRLLTGVREQGYALLDEEWEEGLRSIAVPIHDRTGKVVAAANVALHAARRTAEECVRDILPELRATAARIEGELAVAGRFVRVAPY
jgi:IclR family pca regulon transcriptional regulator